MIIDTRKYNRQKMQKRQEQASQEVKARIARISGMVEPSPKAIQKYIIELDDLRDELTELYGDLGKGPNDAGGIIERERKKALALLARKKVQSANPGGLI